MSLTVAFNVTTPPAFAVEELGIMAIADACTFTVRETIPALAACEVSLP